MGYIVHKIIELMSFPDFIFSLKHWDSGFWSFFLNLLTGLMNTAHQQNNVMSHLSMIKPLASVLQQHYVLLGGCLLIQSRRPHAIVGMSLSPLAHHQDQRQLKIHNIKEGEATQV